MQVTNGSFLRHPTFGVCRVSSVDDSKIRVVFEDGQERTLNATWVAKHCVEIPATKIDPASPLLRDGPRTARPSSSKKRNATEESAQRARPCGDCGKPLNRSLYSADEQLKSCPNCSAEAGYHLFYRHPEAFGTSDARTSDTTPDGVQSHCEACRDNRRASRGTPCDRVIQ